VIKSLFTISENSGIVELPFGSINGNTDWLFVNSNSELINISLGNIGEAFNFEFSGSSLAGSSNSLVGVFVFGGNSEPAYISESSIHHSSVASKIEEPV